MSFDSQNVLDEYKSLIRNRAISWESYIRFQLVTAEDVDKIRALDTDKAKRVQIVERDAKGYAQLVLGDNGILRKSSSENKLDVVQYILTWTGDLLDDVPSFANALLALPKPFEFLLQLLQQMPDPRVPLLSASILTTLIATSLTSSPNTPSAELKDALSKFYKYLSTVSKSGDQDQQDLAIRSYVDLLRTQQAREIFWNMKEDTVSPLAAILEAATGGAGEAGENSRASGAVFQGGVPLQLLYHVLLVIWQLSFEETVAEEINDFCDIILPVTVIIRNSIKEKIARVSLAFLANLVTKASENNLPPLLVTNILPYLQTIQSRYEGDPDIAQDFETIIAALTSFQLEQTSMSSYRMEVMTGHVRWSPPHRNENFWKKHAYELIQDTELIKRLSALLDSTDPQVLSVACNDISCLVREGKDAPGSKRRWEELDVKKKVMFHMANDDPEVRYEALKAVQMFLQTAF